MNRRNVTIAIVAVLALGVALVVYGVLSAPRKVTAPPQNVVVAAMNIPANARIVPTMVTTAQKSTDQVEAGALVDPASAVGMIATADIPQGAQITPERITRAPQIRPGLQVAAGLRAITIAIDPVKGIAGLLQVGDHVDIMAAPNHVYDKPVAMAIVRDARILAVGSDISPPFVGEAAPSPSPGAPTPLPATTVTLAVTPQQADEVMAADLNGVVRLALRSPHEPQRSMVTEAFYLPTPPPPAPPQPPPPTPFSVQVINGDSTAQGPPITVPNLNMNVNYTNRPSSTQP